MLSTGQNPPNHTPHESKQLAPKAAITPKLHILPGFIPPVPDPPGLVQRAKCRSAICRKEEQSQAVVLCDEGRFHGYVHLGPAPGVQK